MAGIYIHIPFCRQSCHYCNFHFSTSKKLLPQMVRAIIKEAALRKEYIEEPVETIYFGGGTPSLCTIDDVRYMIDRLKELLEVSKEAEITLETNPDDFSIEKLSGWKTAGINRLSIGIQSFAEEDLVWMNRAHNVQQAINSIQSAQQQGFDNITIDLIYGTPTLSDEQWKQNIQTALSLNIPHLSCYALTVEPRTALEKLIHQHKKENINTDKQAWHFELLMQWMANAGFEHYEISNFAKPGFRSKHNSSYWQGKPYLGLGPSAHSFNKISRQWNVSNNALYIQNIENNIIPSEKEILSVIQQLNEYILTRLRTIEGLCVIEMRRQFPLETVEAVSKASRKWIKSGHIVNNKHSDFIQLTKKGKLLADTIAADLFQV